MKNPLKFSVVAAATLMAVVPNLALADNTELLGGEFTSSGGTYQGNNGDDRTSNQTIGITIGSNDYSTKDIRAGFSANGPLNKEKDPINNEVIMNGGEVNNIYGAVARMVSGNRFTAKNNTVTIGGGKVKGKIYGGYGQSGGNAISNEVSITNGDVSAVYGGSGDTANKNKVTISGGTTNQIFGGDGLSEASENEVLITGGIIKSTVNGGYINGTGTVSNNKVTISDGTVNANVFGGYSYNGLATGNTVTISGGTVSGSVYGGRSVSANEAIDNRVIISGGEVQGDVVGGYVNSSYPYSNYKATDNTVTYLGGKIIGGIYGGKSGGGSADALGNNILNIGLDTQRLAIGLSAKNIYNFAKLNFYLGKNIAHNFTALTLTDTGETDLSKSTVTAYLSDATNLTKDSTVHLIKTAGTLNVKDEYKTTDGVEQNVNIASLLNVKGYIKLDSTGKNLDLLFKDTSATPTWVPVDQTYNIVASNKYTRLMKEEGNPSNQETQEFTISSNFDKGELTEQSNNTVNINLGSNSFDWGIYGGGSYSTDTKVSGNSVTLNSGTVEAINGGTARAGEVSDNKVIIKGGTTNIVNGGFSESGAVSGNSVTVSGGNIGSVSGGDADLGAASGNFVTISGGSIAGTVCGGFSSSNSAMDNTVTYTGGSVGGVIYGGFSQNTSKDTLAGNTLNIGTSDKRVKGLMAGTIANFEKVNFYTDLGKDEVALSLSNANFIGGEPTSVDLSKSSITVDNLSSYLDGTGNKYYLIKTDGDKVIVDEAWLKDTQNIGDVFNVIGNTQYNVAKGGIFQSADKKDLYITSTANSIEAITGGVFGDDEAGIKDGIKVNLANSAYDKLNINIANSATINLTNAHNVGSVISSGSTLDIKGGSTFDTGASIDVKTANFGDSSDAMVMDIYDISALKAKELNFYLPSNVANDETALKVTNSVDLSGTKVNAYLKDATGITNKDDKIHLIQTAGSITGFAEANGKANLTNVNIAGLINVTGKIAVDSTSKNLDLTFNGDEDTGGGSGSGGSGSGGSGSGGSGSGGATANENSKQLLETNLAGLIAVGEAGSMLGANLDSIVNSAANGGESGGDSVVYAVSSGNDKKYKTGSHVESKGFSVNVGVAGTHSLSSADLTTGAFIEYGRASFETHLDNGLVGKGDTELIGGGVFAKYQSVGGYYTEGSLRVGKLKTEADKGLYDEYEISSSYYGAHFGVGKVFALGASNDLDIYAKYFYSHTQGDEITLKGVNVAFDAMSSHKVKFGVKDTIKFSETSAVYAGLAYQHEFDGDATGRVSVLNQSASIASPSLKGASGIAEVGYTYDSGALKFDIGAKGYAGKERGYSGNVGLTFRF